MTYTKEIAIAGIVIIEVCALLLGHNGVMLAGVIALIAGIAGYEIRLVREKK